MINTNNQKVEAKASTVDPAVKYKALTRSYEYMLRARTVDLIEQDFTARGEAFFHVSGEGHETSAILENFLIPEDWLHCHYRDKALMLARGLTERMLFLALFNKKESHSQGRQMNAHMSSRDLNVFCLGGPVGNCGLQATGVASVIKDQPERPIVLCSLGDGTTQESEFLESVGHAARDELPVLFFIHNNELAISTNTKGRTFFSLPDGNAESFFGIKIKYIDGRRPQECYEILEHTIAEMRETRKPVIIILSVDRLHNHTNADNQKMYRSEEEISQLRESGDPLQNLKSYLLSQGADSAFLAKQEKDILSKLQITVREAQISSEPETTHSAARELEDYIVSPESEYRGTGAHELTMLEAIRELLSTWLANDQRVCLYGEDIEDPKGDVFGITRGLSTAYKDRVKNSPLSESLIVGHSIGQALTGMRPIAMLQFADFLPLAMNQIYSEMGTMYWRSGGHWHCPIILMAPCGAYSPGLGPFHAASMESFVSHVPGLNVVMPTTAADAAGLLNSCFASKRPTVFFYPKVLLNNQDRRTSRDVKKHFVPLGVARTVMEGDAISFITYGNGVTLCKQVAETLLTLNVKAELIDLRSLVPWDKKAAIASALKTKKVIVCSEDNRTSSFSGEIAATIAEEAGGGIEIRRVVREDTYIPCNYANQLEVLPSYKKILETAVNMLSGSITWKKDLELKEGEVLIEAMGSSPSDESVTVIEWKYMPGDSVQEGELLAELEADKASFDLRSPAGGVIEEILVEEGDTVNVGDPLLRLRTQEEKYIKPVTREIPGTPIITGITPAEHSSYPEQIPQKTQISQQKVDNPGIVTICGVTGDRVVASAEIAEHLSNWDAADIIKRTGIENRHWVAPEQNALTMAVDACNKLFKNKNITLCDIDAIVCATGTPMTFTPSMATRIHFELSKDMAEPCELEAFDVNAACSGYIYGLKLVYDDLLLHPEKKVLLVTTEVLSSKIKQDDHTTAPIFGDAATATLLVGSAYKKSYWAELFSPTLSAQGAPPEYLLVPSQNNEYIKMNGQYVFVNAIKNMLKVLAQACERAKIRIEQLDLLVPHQANQRIINMIRQKLRMSKERVFSNIRHLGNTSSNTIPLCLETLLGEQNNKRLLGLVTFGGGFTYGGTVIQVKDKSQNDSIQSIQNTGKRVKEKRHIQGALKRALDRIKKTTGK